MKIEILDGQRKLTAHGAKSLRIVASEEHIQKMSDGSLKAYRTRVLMYSKWIKSMLATREHYCNCSHCGYKDSFPYEENKELVDTVYWLRRAVNREYRRRQSEKTK